MFEESFINKRDEIEVSAFGDAKVQRVKIRNPGTNNSGLNAKGVKRVDGDWNTLIMDHFMSFHLFEEDSVQQIQIFRGSTGHCSDSKII